MRQMLIIWLTNFLRGLLGKTGGEEPAEDDTASSDEPGKCPICGEEWDKGEVFCYHCGYELVDESIPLHPPPDRTGVLTDPDGILDESHADQLREKLASIGREKRWDIGVFILPASLAESISTEISAGGNSEMEGIAYCLYNTWRMGVDTDLNGILLVVDLRNGKRFLVQGRNGPGIRGSSFRNWYSEYSPADDESQKPALAGELEYFAEKIAELR